MLNMGESFVCKLRQGEDDRNEVAVGRLKPVKTGETMVMVLTCGYR